ncbi:hypothetical protein ABM005_10150 [Morganella morganii]|uniref:hypothetical protein n=1 Tax=Morganella morganii TaxID=582 RepID=UPI003EBA01E3
MKNTDKLLIAAITGSSFCSFYTHAAQYNPDNHIKVAVKSDAHAETDDPLDELIALSERVLTEFEHNGIDRQVFRNKIVQSRNILERTHNSVTGILEDIERSYMLTGGPLLIGASLRANEKASPEETEMVLQDFLRHAGKFHAVLLPAE